MKILNLLRNSADLCYSKIKEARGITCPHKPEGSMFVMVKRFSTNKIQIKCSLFPSFKFSIIIQFTISVVQAKLDLSCLDGIQDDLDFCCMLAKEESVIVLPGTFNFHLCATLDASGFQSLFQFLIST